MSTRPPPSHIPPSPYRARCYALPRPPSDHPRLRAPPTVNALAQMHTQCFTTPSPWSAKDFDDLLERPSTLLIHAPQGFLLAQIIAGEVEILTLAVMVEAQRKGHATQILRALLEQARACGGREVFLEVAENNHAAQALYTKAGFCQAGRRKAYYLAPAQTAGTAAPAQAIDALILRHQIS